MNSARSLQDISDERVVPLDYLLSLIVLFMFLVLDRVFYTLGSPLGKVWTAVPCLFSLIVLPSSPDSLWGTRAQVPDKSTG